MKKLFLTAGVSLALCLTQDALAQSKTGEPTHFYQYNPIPDNTPEPLLPSSVMVAPED